MHIKSAVRHQKLDYLYKI